MFTDDDLRRLKEEFEPYVVGDPRILTGPDWLGLIARLEAAELCLANAPLKEGGVLNAEDVKAWRKSAGKSS